MDFFKIRTKAQKNGVVEVYPDFLVLRSKDLMVKGKNFYGIWDEKASLWSTDEYSVQKLVDEELREYAGNLQSKVDSSVTVKYLSDWSSGTWLQFKNYVKNLSDNSVPLDDRVTFENSEVSRNDYVSRRLPYSLREGSIDAYHELTGVLYEPDELQKLEWAIGAILSGDAAKIQKFIVLYGEAGAGKSTILTIIQWLFQGYYTTFEAKALASTNNAFATEVFRNNPLVAIQHDGDLSRIEDNSKLNSIISHEEMTMNEKFKPTYTSSIRAFLFMGTNKPVKITDAKSGIIRRLIDVRPSGRRIPPKKYQTLMSQIKFELGAIAAHCLDQYHHMGKDYYANYIPLDMILKTDVFYNFVESNFDVFKDENGVSLSRAYDMYKLYCDEALVEYKLPKYRFREELKNYFEEFLSVTRVDDKQVRSYYRGFLIDKFTSMEAEKETFLPISLDETTSILDTVLKDQPAQYGREGDIPSTKWDHVTTTLSDIDTREVHYVKLPGSHIVIDFDLKDESGEKSLLKNLEAASKWPPTYAEFSKGGSGIHLHYIYDGDPSELSRVYSEDIEIKVFRGNASLRRRLSRCNNVPIAHLSDGLPKKEKKVLDKDIVLTERSIRSLIQKNLRKEVHPGTKPSVDFIHKILEDAYSSKLTYDVSDLHPVVLAFAAKSTNQAAYCLKRVSEMKFKSEEKDRVEKNDNRPLTFFDIEVYPNLFLVCYKHQGDNKPVVRMFNPTPSEIEDILKFKLVGFNNRRYDNHILYGAYMGFSNEQLYNQSQKIISGRRDGFFGEAYNLSHADIYDFASKKQGLKKWEIELGINHKEMDIPWDQPVPEDRWEDVAIYCDNDVVATEEVFNNRIEDYHARQVLAELSGLPVNETTQKHAAKAIFGNDRNPQSKFVYTNLSDQFPGYVFDMGVSTYRGERTGEGGYVYAEPGIHYNVALLDVASMHPTSIEALNLFGEYTKKFSEIKDARLAIKNGDFETASNMMGGALKKYLSDKSSGDALSYALKIIINSVYGLTSARFPNPFRDERNIDNIVAKRGALFMVDLKHAIQEKGYTVAHIKTDSVKIPDADQEIIDFVMEFGKKYGYEFEHEATYEKMCLVNDAVYIAKYANGKKAGQWVAVGAQFQHPYVFKTLFSKDPIEFKDMCEAKSVTSSMYLNFGKDDNPQMKFVGKVGLFTPVSYGGGQLLREKDGKYYAVTGTKGYRWVESSQLDNGSEMARIEKSYFESLVEDARDNIRNYGDPDHFAE